MSVISNYQDLMKKFFTNAGQFEFVSLYGDERNLDLYFADARIILGEIVDVIEDKLNNPLIFKDDMKILKTQIAECNTLDELDYIVEELDSIIPYCKKIQPTFFEYNPTSKYNYKIAG